jgi:hypothetical protein
MNSVIQQEVVGALAESFFRMLFSSDSKATAQKQQMMAELERRKAEAEQQQKVEEAKRLELICSRLEATLKLSGGPDLQLKDIGASTGGLHLKLGDSTGESTRIHGLPGIALNDTSGNGGSTPYGIKGLPGIYTNGPNSGSGSVTLTASNLQLKTGDESARPTPFADDSVSTSPTVPAEGTIDIQNMSPQQLADVATRVSDLPIEEQQRLMTAAQKNAQVETGTSSEPVPTQLQQIANASQSAATAQSLEGTASQARAGFDQALGSAPASMASASSVSHLTAQPAPVSSTPDSSLAATSSTSSTPSQTPRGSSYSPVRLSSIDLGKTESDKPMVVKQLSNGASARAAGCPMTSTKKLPTREELTQELAGLHFRLDVLKNSLLRLNRSIQMDQVQFSEWERETQDAEDRSKERLKQAIADKIQGRFFDYAEGYYENSPEKLKALKRAEVLIQEGTVYDWADKGEKEWSQVAEGLALLGDNLPLSKSAKEALWASKSIVDSSFDIATELVSWRRISQLQKNSEGYLSAVKQSGEQMKGIVERIREVEDRLASSSYGTVTEEHSPNGIGCESGE